MIFLYRYDVTRYCLASTTVQNIISSLILSYHFSFQITVTFQETFPFQIKKAESDAKKNFKNVPISNATIPHRMVGKFGTTRVLLLPAKGGSGIIAGGAVKAVLELAGYEDVTAKCYGSTNSMNVVKATMAAITKMRTREEVARLRGKTVEEI